MMRMAGLVGALLCAVPLAAQDSAAARDTVLPGVEAPRYGRLPTMTLPESASPPLPIDHWAARAAARAHELGLAPDYFPAQRSARRAEVAAALEDAVQLAALNAPELEPLAASWVARFLEEFPEYSSAPRILLGGRAGVRVEDTQGLLEPAYGLFTARREPFRRRDRTEVAAVATVAAAFGPFAAVAEPVAGGDGARVPLWDVSAAAGPVSLAFGRQPVGYGPVRGGAIVMSGSVPLVRAQLQTDRGVTLPSLLRHLGPVTFHTAVTRLEEPRHPGRPWFWTAHAGLRPHPRFDVGITRASVFGGDSIETPTTLKNVGRMALGLLTGEFENQEVALDLRWRLPTERALPATAYMEWGSEDASGSWWRVPGRTFGLLLPALTPAIAAGAEYTYFAPLCCGNPPWYLHSAQRGGFVYRGELLGHPLGGEGSEAMAYAQADLMDARLRLEARAFTRDRGDEGLSQPQIAGNVYAPLRVGRSVGGGVDAAFRVTPRLDGRASLLTDVGDGWREHRVRVDISYLF